MRNRTKKMKKAKNKRKCKKAEGEGLRTGRKAKSEAMIKMVCTAYRDMTGRCDSYSTIQLERCAAPKPHFFGVS